MNTHKATTKDGILIIATLYYYISHMATCGLVVIPAANIDNFLLVINVIEQLPEPLYLRKLFVSFQYLGLS